MGHEEEQMPETCCEGWALAFLFSSLPLLLIFLFSSWLAALVLVRRLLFFLFKGLFLFCTSSQPFSCESGTTSSYIRSLLWSVFFFPLQGSYASCFCSLSPFHLPLWLRLLPWHELFRIAPRDVRVPTTDSFFYPTGASLRTHTSKSKDTYIHQSSSMPCMVSTKNKKMGLEHREKQNDMPVLVSAHTHASS